MPPNSTSHSHPPQIQLCRARAIGAGTAALEARLLVARLTSP